MSIFVVTQRRLGDVVRWTWFGSLLALVWTVGLPAAELKEAQAQFLAGDYARCIDSARQALKKGDEGEEWALLLCRSLLATGRYPEARTAITNALSREQSNIRLCWQAREACLRDGQPDVAKELTETIVRLVTRHPSFYREPANLVVFGQAALLGGADPKLVLDTLFDVARKGDPKLRDVYLASGGLALDKHDYALAAKRFEEGLKQVPDDPDLHYGMARAYAPSDPAVMKASLEAALARNPNHAGCLLLLADHCVDAEDYTHASELLDRVKAINPSDSDAWAYRAALAHLQNEPDEERAARQAALKFWASNPRVDYLIGLKLSQNYRFTEGAAHQRQALAFEPDYLPAKAQLAQDLLRLGHETEGWGLAQEVQKQDAYDIEAYNLSTLHDSMTRFVTLTNNDFLVRMSSREAGLYGSRVLALLGRARSNLCARYGFEVKRPTVVEIFPEQKDFAVRTFGLPGNPGYLGVCFGTVITANSPAAHPGHGVNWQAVLWHEFCHVVTLQITKNKMPRWLSEGISVFEEGQANPAWGQRMNPRYREMVLGDELTPLSKLSSAFLAPRSELHLQFAYYESSLAVACLVEKFGFEKFKSILEDLGAGTEINAAIAKHTESMEKLDQEFAAYARTAAERLGPGLDWTKPPWAGEGAQPPDLTSEEWANAAAWSATHPTNYYALVERAKRLLQERKFQDARTPLETLVKLYPEQTGEDSASALLAAVYRSLGETNLERNALSGLATRDDETVAVYARLLELASAAQDWHAVQENAERYLAVNPLVALPYRFLATATEQLNNSRATVESYRALLDLDPPDPAQVHVRLARALHQLGDASARCEVLQALEEAPRYREALRLLLEIDRENAKEKGT